MYVLKILLQIIFDILKRRQYPEIQSQENQRRFPIKKKINENDTFEKL